MTNFAPFVMVGLFAWMVLELNFPEFGDAWAMLMAWAVFLWGPVAGAIAWRMGRKEREAAESAQEAKIDECLRAITARYGYYSRQHFDAMRLTGAELDDLFLKDFRPDIRRD